MTDDDKALVERLAAEADNFKVAREVDMRAIFYRAADRIEALSAENERLCEILREVTSPPHFGESEQSKAWWAKARAALGETE